MTSNETTILSPLEQAIFNANVALINLQQIAVFDEVERGGITAQEYSVEIPEEESIGVLRLPKAQTSRDRAAMFVLAAIPAIDPDSLLSNGYEHYKLKLEGGKLTLLSEKNYDWYDYRDLQDVEAEKLAVIFNDVARLAAVMGGDKSKIAE